MPCEECRARRLQAMKEKYKDDPEMVEILDKRIEEIMARLAYDE